MSDWRYYLTHENDQVFTVKNSAEIRSSRQAAEMAAEQYFIPGEHDMNWVPTFVVISPSGDRTAYSVEFEAVVVAKARRVDLPDY